MSYNICSLLAKTWTNLRITVLFIFSINGMNILFSFLTPDLLHQKAYFFNFISLILITKTTIAITTTMTIITRTHSSKSDLKNRKN